MCIVEKSKVMECLRRCEQGGARFLRRRNVSVAGRRCSYSRKGRLLQQEGEAPTAGRRCSYSRKEMLLQQEGDAPTAGRRKLMSHL